MQRNVMGYLTRPSPSRIRDITSYTSYFIARAERSAPYFSSIWRVECRRPLMLVGSLEWYTQRFLFLHRCSIIPKRIVRLAAVWSIVDRDILPKIHSFFEPFFPFYSSSLQLSSTRRFAICKKYPDRRLNSPLCRDSTALSYHRLTRLTRPPQRSILA